MNGLFLFFLLIGAGVIGGMIGFGGALLIFWPELKRPDQLEDAILLEWRQHAGLERHDEI